MYQNPKLTEVSIRTQQRCNIPPKLFYNDDEDALQISAASLIAARISDFARKQEPIKAHYGQLCKGLRQY